MSTDLRNQEALWTDCKTNGAAMGKQTVHLRSCAACLIQTVSTRRVVYCCRKLFIFGNYVFSIIKF